MTTAEITLRTVTTETAEKLNSMLRYWGATVADSVSPIIQLTKTENSDGQNRVLFLDVLDENDDTSDITRYCWHYWNTNRGQWEVSDLSHDADFNEVFDFLVRHLEAE